MLSSQFLIQGSEGINPIAGPLIFIDVKNLTQLFTEMDSTTSTNAKVDALVRYFGRVSDQDKVWAIALLSHRRPPRAVNYRLLGEWAAEAAQLPEWLFAESYHVVGDYAETIALLLPNKNDNPSRDECSERQGELDLRTYSTLTDYMQMMIDLKSLEDDQKKEIITDAWARLTSQESFIFNKLITGGFRVGVSQKLMTRAVAKFTEIEENTVALRLMGKWDPATISFKSLVLDHNPEDNLSRPYPFYLAYALDVEPESLGEPQHWMAERKWDGIRGQIIVRKGNLYVWSRGEELVTEKYPEFYPLSALIPSGTVIDGEIMAYKNGPLPFQSLQKRIGRKNIAKKHLVDIPVRLIAYDLLEWEGEDIRDRPQSERRILLENLIAEYPVHDIVILSEIVQWEKWADLAVERQRARELKCEGLMLKRLDAIYEVGRKRGAWWKWKVDPFTVDCVMIYAQRGHGRRANMYTDFTFALWDGDNLVPFAKAYTGLKNVEFEEITRWVRRNTLERFGPVSVVPAFHVFELHFEGIAKSTRHKSGIAVRFPRIHRWRKDKRPEDADRLEDLMRLL